MTTFLSHYVLRWFITQYKLFHMIVFENTHLNHTVICAHILSPLLDNKELMAKANIIQSFNFL